MEENFKEKETTEPVSLEEANKLFKEMAYQKMHERMRDLRENGTLSLTTYVAVGRFKSIRRAIRRGHVSLSGVIYPKRPFNNRKRGPGSVTYERRKLYEQFRNRQSE